MMSPEAPPVVRMKQASKVIENGSYLEKSTQQKSLKKRCDVCYSILHGKQLSE